VNHLAKIIIARAINQVVLPAATIATRKLTGIVLYPTEKYLLKESAEHCDDLREILLEWRNVPAVDKIRTGMLRRTFPRLEALLPHLDGSERAERLRQALTELWSVIDA